MKSNKLIIIVLFFLVMITMEREKVHAIELGKASAGEEFKPYIGLGFKVSNNFELGITGLEGEWSGGESVKEFDDPNLMIQDKFLGNLVFMGYIQPELVLSFEFDFMISYKHDESKLQDKKELLKTGSNIFEVPFDIQSGRQEKRGIVKMDLKGLDLKLLLHEPSDQILDWEGFLKVGYSSFEVGTEFHEIDKSGLGIFFISENNFIGDIYVGLDIEIFLAQHELFFEEFNPIAGLKFVLLIAPGYDALEKGKLKFECCYLRSDEMYEIGLSTIYHLSQRKAVKNVRDYLIAETRAKQKEEKEGRTLSDLEKQIQIDLSREIYKEVDIKNFFDSIFYFRYANNSHIFDLTTEMQASIDSKTDVGFKVTLTYGNIFVDQTVSLFLMINLGSPVKASAEAFPPKEERKKTGDLVEDILSRIENLKIFGDFHIFQETALKLYVYPLKTKEMELIFYLAYSLEFYGSQNVFENGGVSFDPIFGIDLTLEI